MVYGTRLQGYMKLFDRVAGEDKVIAPAEFENATRLKPEKEGSPEEGALSEEEKTILRDTYQYQANHEPELLKRGTFQNKASMTREEFERAVMALNPSVQLEVEPGARILPGKVILKGSLGRAEIQRVMVPAEVQIEALYSQALSQAEKPFDGRVKVSFSINSSGKVDGVEILSAKWDLGSGGILERDEKSQTTINEQTLTVVQDLEKGMMGVITALQFPQPAGGGVVEVRYPFVFQPNTYKKSILDRLEEGISRLYKMRLRESPENASLEGSVKISFVINKNGEPQNIKVVSKTMSDPKLLESIRSWIQNQDFEAPPDGKEVPIRHVPFFQIEKLERDLPSLAES